MVTSVTASMLYDLVACPHRVTMDLFADPAQRDEPNPFVQLLWEKGSLRERIMSRAISNLAPVRKVRKTTRNLNATTRFSLGSTRTSLNAKGCQRAAVPLYGIYTARKCHTTSTHHMANAIRERYGRTIKMLYTRPRPSSKEASKPFRPTAPPASSATGIRLA